MDYSKAEIWLIIVVLGIGTFFLRYSFLGLIGNRALPEWALRYLRYTPVAVLPGLVAPLVLWPSATQGEIDPARLIAAGATVLVGIVTRNTLAAILGGLGALYLGLWLIG
ncbi:AzlD domain-containing protein [Sedimentimonas flavescens]|uniref:AzlD domain-containing protein n=1 Tax=Sedimentimonas flavescens TaxID=2851012 RepID=A0ABT3A1P1_9RHOB|nr:AzlD domain-containing protein [Sedimentimonas flavescens]MBW0157933.1 AzlD domain-containing protein [Sedimentimonas flavescens]MCT2539941.1 AzlD domain-containing protein [Sedimentimonas flavescens]MCV2879897.1 AzlD domain-containing protein [Sedimentimonas flavescens]